MLRLAVFALGAAVLIAPADAVLLKPGASVEQALNGAERFEYEVALNAGDYVAITIDQRGVDLYARTYDAAGTSTALFDDELRPDGREQVAFVADATRSYKIAVAARYPKLAAGRFAIWIDAVRASTDRDRAGWQSRTLESEAAALRGTGKFDEALAKAKQSLTLAESAFGPDSLNVSVILNTLAGTQRSKGQLQDAEASFLRSIAISETVRGRDHPQTGSLKETLGVMYNAMDDFAKAEPLMTEGTALVERGLGDHPRLATCLMDLALFHTNRGDRTRALAELQQALRVSDKTMSPDDFGAIAIVNNLGDLYVTMKDYDRAQPLVERAVRDIERTLGADNYRVATPLLNLGVIARERGDYPRALEHLHRAYALREKTFGKDSTDAASLRITIGNIYHAQKDYPTALEEYQQARDVLERTAGPYHNLTVMAINNAARTLAATGDVDAAIARRAEFEARLDRAVAYNLAIGSERDKLAYLEHTFERMGRTISLHLRQAPDNRQAAVLAANAILRRKARVLDAALDTRAALRRHLGADDRKILDELGRVTSQLSTLALGGPGRTPAADYRTKLAGLERQRDDLEADISRRSAQYRAEEVDADTASVSSMVPPDAALIEFVVYEPFDPKAVTDASAHGDPRYAAYVLRRGMDPRGIDLGPVKSIDAAVTKLRAALRDPSRADVTSLARALDQSVLRPVRGLTGDATHLLIAPDGALNLVPFEALVDQRGRYQVQRYAITYLAAGRDLLRLQMPRTSGAPPVVVADPAFGEPSMKGTAGASAERAASSPGSPSYFAPLSGTAQEARAIGRFLPGAVVLTGTRATKRALEDMTSPSILHVASHAFFTPPAKTAAPDPLLRSGIALAGANLPRDGGVLTALEAAALNLWGTQLVTLSACDTGVGEVKNGEGVYGLRRAFFLAGTETLVMSLWPVSDYVTRTMMTDFYRGLSQGLGRGAALRRVQLAMLKDPQRRHPFYWAAFIQAGDWTPLSAR